MSRQLHVRKGDLVRVMTGKNEGQEGKVIAVLPEADRVIVEGVNRVKRHTKVQDTGGRQGKTGGIVSQEAPIHVSNVMLVVEVEESGKKRKVPTRVGFDRVEVQKRRPDGSTYTGYRSVRVARRTGEEI